MPTSAADVTPVRSAEALGRAIKSARKRAGWTQAELTERARMNRYAVLLLETGHETRAIEQLFDALAALDLELAVRPRGSGAR